MPVINVAGFENCICHHPDLINLYGCEIGNETKIGAFVEIGPAKIGARCKIQSHAFIPEGVTIEDDVFIGPGAVFCNVKKPDPHKSAERYEHTLVKRGAVIGANATILPGVTIGEGAIVGAGVTVTKDVNPGEVYIK